MINRDNYIQERLDKQISWYNKKSSNAKVTYILISITILILTSSIPVFMSLNNTNDWRGKIVVASFGSISAILTGVVNVVKCKDNWIRYRQLVESLEQEKMMYCTKCKEYSESNALDKLIEKCEELMKLENDMWVSANNSKSK